MDTNILEEDAAYIFMVEISGAWMHLSYVHRLQGMWSHKSTDGGDAGAQSAPIGIPKKNCESKINTY
jgi:hypothetical protein